MAVGAFDRTRLRAGELEADFLPGLGMLGCSLRHRGEELLRRVDDRELAAAAVNGATVGIPLMYPYANRLAESTYSVLGKTVRLDPRSRWLSLDEQGLLLHGVRWGALRFEVTSARADRLVAQLDWKAAELLAVYPFRHRLELAAVLDAGGLEIAATIHAEEALPVAFGFHPYFGIPGLARAAWHIELPAMRKLVLDERRVPTGAEVPFPGMDRALADWDCDAGFAVPAGALFVLSGAGRRVSLRLGAAYRYVQVFAPRGRDFIALEPMTAPANALVSGSGLAIARPGAPYRAAFRIGVEAASPRGAAVPACG